MIEGMPISILHQHPVACIFEVYLSFPLTVMHMLPVAGLAATCL